MTSQKQNYENGHLNQKSSLSRSLFKEKKKKAYYKKKHTNTDLLE